MGSVRVNSTHGAGRWSACSAPCPCSPGRASRQWRLGGLPRCRISCRHQRRRPRRHRPKRRASSRSCFSPAYRYAWTRMSMAARCAEFLSALSRHWSRSRPAFGSTWLAGDRHAQGMTGLAMLVHQGLSADPFDGAVFAFQGLHHHLSPFRGAAKTSVFAVNSEL